MAFDNDYLALYQQLGMGPECNLDALRKAYRRRVAQLHPDRATVATDQTDELQRLNAMYHAAIRFYLRHGRLPGTLPVAPRRKAKSGTPMRVSSIAKPARTGRSRVVLLTIALAVVATLILTEFEEGDEPDATPSGTEVLARADASVSAAPAAPSTMDLGMTAMRVLAIEGEPVARSEQLWEYGPSWIRFECGVVSDWYSSALRPLRVSSRRPIQPTNLTPDAGRDRCRQGLPDRFPDR